MEEEIFYIIIWKQKLNIELCAREIQCSVPGDLQHEKHPNDFIITVVKCGLCNK